MRHFATTGACLDKLFPNGPLVSLELGSCDCCNDDYSDSDDDEHSGTPPAQTRGLAPVGVSTSHYEPGGRQAS